MKQTEKVNIGGYSFTLERDAYERLNGYIEDIRNTYCENSYASEIMSDIEQRIAELFIEKGGKDSVVSYALVDAVIHRIGSPAELADEEKAESGIQEEGGTDKKTGSHDAAYPDGPKRLYRDIDHRVSWRGMQRNRGIFQHRFSSGAAGFRRSDSALRHHHI